MPSPAEQLRNACWFSKLPDAGECEGPRVVRCHLLRQQKMRQEFPYGIVTVWDLSAPGGLRWKRATREIARRPEGSHVRTLETLQADPRGWVWGCGGQSGIGGHHGRLDTAPHERTRLRVPRALIPPETEEFAGELDLLWWLDETYGPKEST